MAKDSKKTQVTIKVRTATHESLTGARRKYMAAKDVDVSLAEFTDKVVVAGIKAMRIKGLTKN